MAAWLTKSGWCIGLPGGTVIKPNDRSIRLPEYDRGASLVRDHNGIRQLFCATSGSGAGSVAAATDTVVTEVIRNGRIVS